MSEEAHYRFTDAVVLVPLALLEGRENTREAAEVLESDPGQMG